MTDRDALRQAKYRLSQALQQRGETINSYSSTNSFEAICGPLGLPRQPRESVMDYISRCVRAFETGRLPSAFKGVPAAPRVINTMNRKAFKWPVPVNPRAAQVDALPRPISMQGIGNGSEISGYGRGK